MGLMFTNNPLGHDFNEPMVDRLLGKAYQTIKEVHENLSEITNAVAVTEDNKQVKESIEKLNSLLESFETGAGLFLGHDLGEVGEENDPNTYIGDNSLSAIAKSAEHLETVSNNIDTLNLLSIHINELKAIAEALEDILNIQSSVETVEKITDYIDDIKKVSVNVGTITTVNSSLDDIKKLADNVETFPEIINSTDDIIKVAKYISSIVTCASNVATYLEANKNLKNAQEILEDGSIKKVADIAEPVQTVANNISSINKVAENIDNIGDSSALEPRVEALENTSASYETRIKANETAKVDHDSRITTNTADISTLNSKVSSVETTLTTQATTLADHTKRLDSMETASDVGQFATRLQAIEDKNVEQDTALDNETKARIAKEELLDAKDTELTNALADEQQAREQKDTSLETKNTEQDGRLDAIETKNTEQDGRLDAIETKNTEQVTEINSHLKTIDAKNTEQDTNISNNTKAITDLSKSLIAKTSGLWADTETMHNNIYRGADLLSAGHFSSINDIITAISQGNFEDIFVGDYFTASYTVDGAQQSAKFRIAGINYFKAAANEWGVQDNHVCIVPDTLGSSVMNDTNVTTGGYIGSKMYTTVLPKYYAALAGSVGTPFYGHIKAMKESLVNGVDNTIQAGGGIAKWTGAATGWADIANISLCLLSELEIYGTRNFGTAGDNVKNAAQLPMFRLNPNTITVWGTKNTWLRSVAVGTAFCYAGDGFHAGGNVASDVLAVRPRFAIG